MAKSPWSENATAACSSLPRLPHDCEPTFGNFATAHDNPAYTALQPLLRIEHPSISRVNSWNDIETKMPHSNALKLAKALAVPFVLLASPCGAACCVGKLRPFNVPDGSIAITMNNGTVEFLPPGWHWLLSPFRKLERIVPLHDEIILVGPKGILTINPGKIGYLEDQGYPIVLGPGMHQWDSPTVRFVGIYDVNTPELRFGPYTLLTVNEGECAVTSDNGVFKVLGISSGNSAETRSYLLNHARWTVVARLSTVEQFDILKANQVMTADRVEVTLESTVAWRISNPEVAARQGGSMDNIRHIVHREARATVAAIIIATKISTGIRTPDSRALRDSRAVVAAVADGSDAPPAEGVVITGHVNQTAVDACSRRLERVGVAVDTINIVQINIDDKQIRENIAKAAVINTQVQEKAEVAKVEARNIEIRAQAEAESTRLRLQAESDGHVANARAKALATELQAKADADALQLRAAAMLKAGEIIAGNETARLLETIRYTGDALNGAKATLFLTPGQDISRLVASQTVNAGSSGAVMTALNI